MVLNINVLDGVTHPNIVQLVSSYQPVSFVHLYQTSTFIQGDDVY